MAATSPDHLHTTADEYLIMAFSIAGRVLCMGAAAYIFFGTVYLPQGCDAEAVTVGTNAGYIAIGVLTLFTAYLSTYGTNWTPVVGKYEWTDALFSGMLAVIVIAGVLKNWGAMSSLMTFAASMFGTMVVLGIGFDWIARLVKRRAHLRAEAATRTPAP